jgi:uncharacterized protein (DUF2126 family)
MSAVEATLLSSAAFLAPTGWAGGARRLRTQARPARYARLSTKDIEISGASAEKGGCGHVLLDPPWREGCTEPVDQPDLLPTAATSTARAPKPAGWILRTIAYSPTHLLVGMLGEHRLFQPRGTP